MKLPRQLYDRPIVFLTGRNMQAEYSGIMLLTAVEAEMDMTGFWFRVFGWKTQGNNLLLRDKQVARTTVPPQTSLNDIIPKYSPKLRPIMLFTLNPFGDC